MVELYDAGETREPLRGLVETIRLIPREVQLRIAVPGELGAILRLAEGARGARNDKRPGVEAEALVEQIKLGCGDRQPPTVADRVPKLTARPRTERRNQSVVRFQGCPVSPIAVQPHRLFR